MSAAPIGPEAIEPAGRIVEVAHPVTASARRERSAAVGPHLPAMTDLLAAHP